MVNKTSKNSLTEENKNNDENRVFVYGTLKPGEDNFGHFCYGKYLSMVDAYTYGDIYDLPLGFPAMVESKNKAYGVVYEFVDKETTKQIDILEGYNEDLPYENNLYYKKQIRVFNKEGKNLGLAWAYFMNINRVLACGGHLVKDGNWSRSTPFDQNKHQQLIDSVRE